MVSTNPFASRQVRPGAIPFQFSKDQSAEQIIERLRHANWRGAILGPHGSGKSTLLDTLSPLWRDHGLTEQRVTLHSDGQSTGTIRLPGKDEILVVDGFEQLSWLKRRWFLARCAFAGSRLLVTTHTEIGLPIVFQTEPSEEMAIQLTEMLQRDVELLVTAEDARATCRQHGADLRETLFQLYHLYESRRELRSSGDDDAKSLR
ncbi:hypothetical protein LOC68_05125 [Blastopirellula sp. JC732]|uniref:Uncharacterized protein n=1 Tax=Blastopirellula sediminis TaxID=2894196 RepID=A0A9X1MIL6_9BACT|nr:hypothetical protein [Blastopirellula sediminis]MCC9609455.1 hypothetical protein [Blastopirellula sediminis]MCC9627768.1 hypothetical protein [Blastopirellula sediminis]